MYFYLLKWIYWLKSCLCWWPCTLLSRPSASHVPLLCKNLNFKCGIVIDEQYSWMQGSFLNYHIIAMNICRLICLRIADLTSSKTTLILNVIKWCFQAHFRCKIQAWDCQLLKEMGYLLAQEERTGSGNKNGKDSSVNGRKPSLLWNIPGFFFFFFWKNKCIAFWKHN